MNFANIPLFNLMQEKMHYHSARQAELAQNVANVDTPGYLARDLKAPNFAAMAARAANAMHLAETNSRHMQPGDGKGRGAGASIQRENTYELNPIGNNVVIEEEMMRVAENQSEYQKVLGIYRKSLDMFKIALGKAGG
jgi:flagellar basal-body rod protein FlgB